MGSLEDLDSTLRMATRLLDAAAAQVRDLPLSPVRDHVRLIGEAMAKIFEIQDTIYQLHPEFRPAYLDQRPRIQTLIDASPASLRTHTADQIPATVPAPLSRCNPSHPRRRPSCIWRLRVMRLSGFKVNPTPNVTFDRTVGSHSLAAAGQRGRYAAAVNHRE